jgi:hypothetical protein
MNRSDRPRTLPYAALLAVATMAALSAGCAGARDEQTQPTGATDRQTKVAERGASVMPFDLERTTHRFSKTETGGVQTVVADDPDDSTQIGLIQQHLRHEAEQFRGGNFTDPADIHGSDMPGLTALRNSAGKITIDYATTADGARITYTSTDTDLRSALHAWFDAQVSDHGAHATHG